MGKINFKTQSELASEALASWRSSVSVSAAQARIALVRRGILPDVETLVGQSGNEELAVAWEYATVFDRNSVFVQEVSTQLGLTEADMDELFKTAESVEV